MQLTADQQVTLAVSGEDAYGNPVDITGSLTWASSDTAIITVTQDLADPTRATASAVGPVGTAAVTVSNDLDDDSTPDFVGSLAIDVMPGDVTEIVITPGTPTDKTQDAQ